MELVHIKLDLIDPHPHQPREDMGDLDALADSIAEIGVVQPVVLMPMSGKFGGKTGRYVTVAGHRRIEASKRAGLADVPAIIVGDWGEADQMLRLMAENELREDMTAEEHSRGLQTILALDVDVERIAKAVNEDSDRLGKARVSIERHPGVQMSFSEAVAAADLTDEEFEALKDKIGRYDFALSAQDTVRRRVQRERQEATIRELEEQGAIYMSRDELADDEAYWPLEELEIEVDDHKSCPGHAFTLDYSGSPVWICQNPQHYGHAIPDAETSEQKRHNEAIKAEYDAKIAIRDGAHERRLAFARGLLSPSVGNMKPTMTFTAEAVMSGWCATSYNIEHHRDSCAEWFFDGAIGRPSIDSMPHIVICGMVLAFVEGTVGSLPLNWAPNEYSQSQPRMVAAWLPFLQRQGYKLDEYEAALLEVSEQAIAAWEAKAAKKREASNSTQPDEEAEDDGQCAGCDCDDEDACTDCEWGR